jgi:hypothetical protein
VTAVTDVALDAAGNLDVEESTLIMIAYRHFWTEDVRSSIVFGNTTADLTDIDRTQWGVNVFKNYTKDLAFGLEAGEFIVNETGFVNGTQVVDPSSFYLQLSAKYDL